MSDQKNRGNYSSIIDLDSWEHPPITQILAWTEKMKIEATSGDKVAAENLVAIWNCSSRAIADLQFQSENKACPVMSSEGMRLIQPFSTSVRKEIRWLSCKSGPSRKRFRRLDLDVQIDRCLLLIDWVCSEEVYSWLCKQLGKKTKFTKIKHPLRQRILSEYSNEIELAKCGAVLTGNEFSMNRPMVILTHENINSLSRLVVDILLKDIPWKWYSDLGERGREKRTGRKFESAKKKWQRTRTDFAFDQVKPTYNHILENTPMTKSDVRDGLANSTKVKISRRLKKLN